MNRDQFVKVVEYAINEAQSVYKRAPFPWERRKVVHSLPSRKQPDDYSAFQCSSAVSEELLLDTGACCTWLASWLVDSGMCDLQRLVGVEIAWHCHDLGAADPEWQCFVRVVWMKKRT